LFRVEDNKIIIAMTHALRDDSGDHVFTLEMDWFFSYAFKRGNLILIDLEDGLEFTNTRTK
jgi:hypothetical protein